MTKYSSWCRKALVLIGALVQICGVDERVPKTMLFGNCRLGEKTLFSSYFYLLGIILQNKSLTLFLPLFCKLFPFYIKILYKYKFNAPLIFVMSKRM